ncbi:MAG: flagellar biosynthesis protein FlhF [Thermincola sp.]|nr:flagellar biosynthesis protein FlhF [Thermincola sp.]MDT3701775.1 flagellar biosynthesis protein FlhF [Thermincola sp.]
MRVKRFTAATQQEAMMKVKMDMGKDAVILHTRKFKEGGWLFGLFGKVMFEITAAIEDVPTVPASRAAVPCSQAVAVADIAVAGQSSAVVPVLPINDESELREDIQEMKQMLNEVMSQIDASQDVKNFPKPLQKYYQVLIDNDVEEKLVKKIFKELMKRLSQEEMQDDECVEKALEKQILKILKKSKPISFKKQGFHQQSVALIGPTGVGKTTTIAKLAATYSIVDKKKVALITADTYRVAAVEQLKTYGEIIGISVEVVFTPAELQAAISRHPDKDLILIDTAGRSHKNTEQMVELKSFLDIAVPSDVFLVLSATTRSKDMTEIVNSYSDIPLTRLVFTKLDETSSFGAILNVIASTQKSLSYITVGQNVPDDIEVADSGKIAKMMIRES